jgi:hypothetical protein
MQQGVGVWRQLASLECWAATSCAATSRGSRLLHAGAGLPLLGGWAAFVVLVGCSVVGQPLLFVVLVGCLVVVAVLVGSLRWRGPDTW